MGSDEYLDVAITPIGSLRYPYLYFSASGGGGNHLDASYLFRGEERLIVYETPELLEYFASFDAVSVLYVNFFIVLEEGITEETAPELFAYIKSMGNYLTYDPILIFIADPRLNENRALIIIINGRAGIAKALLFSDIFKEL